MCSRAAIAGRRNAFFTLALFRLVDAVISAHIGNAQSLGVDSIPDGSASLMELALRPRERQR